MDYKERIIALLNDKELSQEQKEKLESIFPELKESEDERIRKGIIRNLEYLADRAEGFVKDELKERITWLEKQGKKKSIDDLSPQEAMDIAVAKCFEQGGQKPVVDTKVIIPKFRVGDIVKSKSQPMLSPRKIISIGKDCYWCEDRGCIGFAWDDDCEIVEQKPADKVEPKFKVGDWLQYRDAEPFLVKGIIPKGYVNGNALLPFEWENEAHIWTIQDAKDGDMLINEFHLIFIFKEIKNNMYVSHCSVIDRENDTILNSIAEREVGNVNLVKCLPASKKQRDKLEEVIQREGYEWDTEKKELKKIDKENLTEFEIAVKNVMEEAIEAGDTHNLKADAENLLRIAQPKQEWSEEDEKEVAVLEAYIRSNDWSERHIDRALGIVDELVNKVKSLRPKSRWKPSEGQLECLGYAIEKAEKDWSPLTNNRIYLTLKALKEQLEKLREE